MCLGFNMAIGYWRILGIFIGRRMVNDYWVVRVFGIVSVFGI